MIGAFIVIILLLFVALSAAFYLLGFRLGGNYWQTEVLRVRAEAARAAREMHQLTQRAFVAMAEEADRRRRP